MKKKMERVAPMTKMLNGKRVPVCDYHGTCTNKAYKESFFFLVEWVKRTEQSWRKNLGGEVCKTSELFNRCSTQSWAIL